MSQLLDDVKSGDANAIVAFYHQFSSKIAKYLKQKLPKEEDASEILNDVFLEAIDSLFMLKKDENVSAWLYQIAHNKIVDFYRKRKIKSILLSQMPFLDIVAEEVHQPEFQFEKNKIRDRIETALHGLSEKYREILYLHYEEHVPVKELAIHFNLSFKATESLLFRARKNFRDLYERA